MKVDGWVECPHCEELIDAGVAFKTKSNMRPPIEGTCEFCGAKLIIMVHAAVRETLVSIR